MLLFFTKKYFKEEDLGFLQLEILQVTKFKKYKSWHHKAL